MPKLIDLTGLTIANLKVVKFVGGRRANWICICLKCGQERLIHGYNIRNGRSTQCGKCRYKLYVKHGHGRRGKHSPTFTTWAAMKERCNNPNHRAYKWYGGKGIKICKRWDISFGNFLSDMGERPTGMSLDRL